jgi:riboflavin kinase / FMN adenylyltransferase
VIVAHAPEELEPARRAVAIGTFDGVHRGHERVLSAARVPGFRSTVVTFDPHPRLVLGFPVELLTTLERRLELLEAAGVDDTLVLRFDESLRTLAPEEFAERVLRAIGTEVIAAGAGFRFGRGRAGDLELLARLGFDVRPVPILDGCSSSEVRALLHAGDVAHAAMLLGRPPEADGIVVHGAGRGRLLGFPTANLDSLPDLLVPALGIYAGAVLGHRAAISVGTNPTYGETERRVEAHLLDFDGDLYGQRLVVELWQRLRDEAAFHSEAELIAAIEDDVARTREAVRPG